MRCIILLPFRHQVLVTVLALQGLAACSLLPAAPTSTTPASTAPTSTAYEDCFNHPPLYRTEHGCYEGD